MEKITKIIKSYTSSDYPVKNAQTGKYENVDFQKGIGFQLPPIKVSYNKRDALIFANSIYATASEPHFLYELHPDFAAFPTLPINLAFKQTSVDVFDFIERTSATPIPGIPPFDPQRSVDGERYFETLIPIPADSSNLDLYLETTVTNAYEKSGNLITENETLLVDRKTGTAYSKMTSSAFGIGQGGYGERAGPKSVLMKPPPREPDAVHEQKTTQEVAFLYRLNGDYNPLHADNEFGKRAGFKGLILQGLGTWNISAHAILQSLGNSDPLRFRSFGARFANVVYPGDTLVTKMWKVGSRDGCDEILFQTVCKESGKIVLSNGMCTIYKTALSAKAKI